MKLSKAAELVAQDERVAREIAEAVAARSRAIVEAIADGIDVEGVRIREQSPTSLTVVSHGFVVFISADGHGVNVARPDTVGTFCETAVDAAKAVVRCLQNR